MRSLQKVFFLSSCLIGTLICYWVSNFFSIFELYVIELLILLTVILFNSFLGVAGVFYIFILSSVLFLIKLGKNFFLFNGENISIFTNFGTNNHFSYVYKSEFGLLIDFISYNFSLLTSIIAFFVLFYAFSYMRNEPKIILFIIFLKSFILSMITLLWAANWFVFILGWEMIGVTSFLLINFWTSKITTLKSAYKAFVFNKLSDGCLIIATLLTYLWGLEGFFNSSLLETLTHSKNIIILNFEINFNEIFLFFLIICAFCKSAQFGFHIWLPDSMEAPVPASALIHSATLVSAGIYLLMRYSVILLNSMWLPTFILISTFTAFYGSLISCFQTDVKKILAYSTISHCGFLMFSLTLNNPYITILYLFGHGFYKSLSFMGAGNLIQWANNYQDSRRMGNFSYKYVFEFFFLIVCLFNLSSFPFFLNFFAKHFLFNGVNTNVYISCLAYVFLFLAAFNGVFYSARIIYFAFYTFKKTHISFNKVMFVDLMFAFKTSNWLSLVCMFGLFSCALIVMLILLYFIITNGAVFLDTYANASLPTNFLNLTQFLYLKILFLYIIFTLLLSFIAFKSYLLNVHIIYLTFLIIVLLF